MGIRLVVEVLDHAPPALGQGDVLMLVAIAESANDHTREGWPGMDLLAQRTRIAVRSVRRTLTRLEAAGLIARVAVGTDRNGAPIYAHRGHATVYRIERLAAVEPTPLPVPADPDDTPQRGTPRSPIPAIKGDATVRHLRGKGGPTGPERGTARSGKGDPAVPPSLKEPSRNPQPSGRAPEERGAVIDALLERTGRTIPEEQADRVIRQLLAGRTVRHRAAYLRGAIHRDPNPERFLPTPVPPPYRHLTEESTRAHA